MNTTQLQYFLVLSQTLNYSTASQRLYVTQPTLSRSIMALEDEIGAKLFFRESGNVTLTPAGQLLSQELEPLSLRYAGMLRRVKNLGSGLAGEIHIALSNEQQMPESLLSAIKTFGEKYPNVEFRFSRLDTQSIVAGLREESVDLAVGLVFGRPMDRSRSMAVESVLLETERPCLICAARGPRPTSVMTTTTHECARKLSKTKLIFPSPQYLADNTADPVTPLREMLHLPELMPEVQYVSDTNAVSLYVAAGRGVTIVNQSHSITRENGVDVLEILGAEPYRKALQYRADYRNPILARFLNWFQGNKG